MSWLSEEELLLNNDHVLFPTKMPSINIHIFHVKQKTIIGHKRVKTDLVENRLPFSNLEQIIKQYEVHNNDFYRISDLMLYNIDLSPDEALSFSQLAGEKIQTMAKTRFTKHMQLYKNIDIPTTIPVFHSINSIIIIFDEIRSILKTSSNYTKKQLHIEGGGLTRKAR